MINKEELLQLFMESGFIYPAKVESINLDLAMSNIIDSYKTDDHTYKVERDESGKLTAHVGMLKLHRYYKSWLGHHHCSISSGAGARVFIQFALWVSKNYGTKIEHLYGVFKRNGQFYEGIRDAVNNPYLCNITDLICNQGSVDEIHPLYGLNLSQWHVKLMDPRIPRVSNMEYSKFPGYKLWYFKCTKDAIEKSFKFFNQFVG
jgi:hypothetical protein